jgi:hypothetical protein
MVLSHASRQELGYPWPHVHLSQRVTVLKRVIPAAALERVEVGWSVVLAKAPDVHHQLPWRFLVKHAQSPGPSGVNK